MAKKITFLAILGLLFWQSATACDACGCSIAGNGMGIDTYYFQNLRVHFKVSRQLRRLLQVTSLMHLKCEKMKCT